MGQDRLTPFLNQKFVPEEETWLKKMTKKREQYAPRIFYNIYYPSLNVIGRIILTFTGRPRCFPGFHLGEDLITRMAS